MAPFFVQLLICGNTAGKNDIIITVNGYISNMYTKDDGDYEKKRAVGLQDETQDN